MRNIHPTWIWLHEQELRNANQRQVKNTLKVTVERCTISDLKFWPIFTSSSPSQPWDKQTLSLEKVIENSAIRKHWAGALSVCCLCVRQNRILIAVLTNGLTVLQFKCAQVICTCTNKCIDFSVKFWNIRYYERTLDSIWSQSVITAEETFFKISTTFLHLWPVLISRYADLDFLLTVWYLQ